MPTRWQSITGGILRGLSNDKRSAGLTGSNVKTDNPHTYTWIGQETSDLRQPIQKEQTQQPALPFGMASGGTQYSYQNPLPTDIRMLLTQGSPGTDVGTKDASSDTGSLNQSVPGNAPMNNGFQSSGYGMSPQNGDHFKYYFANSIGAQANNKVPFPSSVLNAVQVQQNSNTDGNPDVWKGAMQVFGSMSKGYAGVQPVQITGFKYS
jgi:hypothetical protein